MYRLKAVIKPCGVLKFYDLFVCVGILPVAIPYLVRFGYDFVVFVGLSVPISALTVEVVVSQRGRHDHAHCVLEASLRCSRCRSPCVEGDSVDYRCGGVSAERVIDDL